MSYNKLDKVDLLDVDKQIAQQNFVCLSFVSPEYEIKKRELFEFEQFVKNYDFNKSMEKMNQFLNFVSFKYNLTVEDIQKDFKEFVDTEKENLDLSIENDYKNFIDRNEDILLDEYNKKNKFQTSVRGIKVRGVFPTQEEAELRCKVLRELDPNHDIYVGPVGTWVPFHPEAYKTGKVEYLENELNNLMHEKQKNQEKAKAQFDQRVKEEKLKAIKENMEKATEHNNVLTQTINEKGELVGLQNVNSQEKTLGVNASIEDIQNELFEGDDIITSSKNSLADNTEN